MVERHAGSEPELTSGPVPGAAAEDEFVGNALCLDFANTLNARPRPTRDHLDAAETLAAWAHAAGLGDAATVAAVAADPAYLAAARELREAIYRTFSAVAAGTRPAAADLAAILAVHAEAVGAARLEPDGDRFTLTWPDPDPRWPIAVSAAHLLQDGPLDRVGECPSCHWLFLDTSRNGRRRWCSMATCGSRIKAQRHYASKSGRADL
ncbi:CGNR zinc finger domain-containing protein [Catenulispora subtropica]|uniref:CGNR zinc finger domain-containing protein n=1 Tax=Catenulispora subtropica TaxID=450798 RepID=A0ABP5EP51_9ACTN